MPANARREADDGGCRTRPQRPVAGRASLPAGSRRIVELQRLVGNRAVTALLSVQRDIKAGDRVAMKQWGKDSATQAAALRAMGPARATAAISEFCAARAKKVTKGPPTFVEVRDELGLSAQEAPAPSARTTRAEGLSFDLELINDAIAEVGFDDHQSKHQTLLLPGLKAYSGAKAKSESKFPSSVCGVAWHTANTAGTARRWIVGLNARGRLDPPGTKINSATGEDFEREAIGYVATAVKDDAGKLYCSYHCYPLAGWVAPQ